MDKKQKQIIKISVFITSIFVILLSVTYAFINVQLTGTKKQVITAGTLDLELLEDNNNLTIADAMPMYDEVGMLQNPFTFRLINNVSTPTNYVLKLVDITTGDKLDTKIVKYGLTKNGVGTPALLSTLPEDGTIDSGTIGNKETIEYTLRLWIDSSVTDNTLISGKSLSYRIDVEVSQGTENESGGTEDESGEPVSTKAFATENLGENCKTYDDGTDTFLVGQCSQNYVWYSGKLWRVVLKNNETGAVKMVTDNAITSIPYNERENTAFENSYMDQWLNQEFLPTLHDYEDYLVVDSVWDATEDSSSVPSRPTGTTTVTRTVGLLNAYEYYTTGTSYLDNGLYWWLITPYDSSYVRYVRSGTLDYAHPNGGYGARPSVNLKSTIQIDSGGGSKSDPYILKGDAQETTNGTTLLSTRYSGEYVTFNNELYRIVDKETIDGETLTKITAVDKPSELTSNDFDSSNSPYVISFAEAEIKTDLEDYYQNLATTNETAYNMIQPNTTWYLGAVGDLWSDLETTGNYKASICATIDASISMNACTEKAASTTASIGLPRVGEMFTSLISGGAYYFWTLTPYNSDYVCMVDYDSSMYGTYSTEGYGARPSMYLKSTIKIASTNTGNGTYEKPYSIEMPN